MTVVYGPDTFTVASDTAINAYPAAGAKFAYNIGSGTTLTVNAANDRVQNPTTGDGMARCTDAAMPTGDQEVTASGYAHTGAGDNSGNVVVRVPTDGTGNGYVSYTNAGNCVIYRCDTGSFVQLVTAARTYTAGAQPLRLKATGTNPVAVEFQLGATAVVTASDNTANRKQSGVPGIHIFNGSGNVAFVDDFQVDNLGAAAVVGPERTAWMIGQAVMRASLR